MKKRLVSMILAVIMVTALALTAAGCGSSGAKGVVKTFFESIDKQDSKQFLKCFEKETREQFEDYFDEEDLEIMLETLDTTLEDEYGKKWIKEIKIGKVEKEDTDEGITYYTVSVEMDGEEADFPVIKVKGKYYIGEDAMNDLAF